MRRLTGCSWPSRKRCFVSCTWTSPLAPWGVVKWRREEGEEGGRGRSEMEMGGGEGGERGEGGGGYSNRNIINTHTAHVFENSRGVSHTQKNGCWEWDTLGVQNESLGIRHTNEQVWEWDLLITLVWEWDFPIIMVWEWDLPIELECVPRNGTYLWQSPRDHQHDSVQVDGVDALYSRDHAVHPGERFLIGAVLFLLRDHNHSLLPENGEGEDSDPGVCVCTYMGIKRHTNCIP